MRLSLAIIGNQNPESWLQKGHPVAYHDLATAVQRILNLFRIKSFDTQPADPTFFQYGLTYIVNKKPLVSLGLVKPKLTKLVDLKQPVFYADFDWQALLKLATSKVRYEEVSDFRTFGATFRWCSTSKLPLNKSVNWPVRRSGNYYGQ